MRVTTHTKIALVALVAFCEVGPTQATRESRLPAPVDRGGAELWTVLAKRKSSRVFGSRALTELELGQLLWAGQGSVNGTRTAPSAGALYPLTLRVVGPHGMSRYVSRGHLVVREELGDRRRDVAEAVYWQQSVRDAPITIAISGEMAITASKYGNRAAERFVTLEAGHAAQNILLAATALGLAAVPIGAFDERKLRAALALREAETPLYVIAVGAPP